MAKKWKLFEKVGQTIVVGVHEVKRVNGRMYFRRLK